jgi:hypothetical protein
VEQVEDMSFSDAEEFETMKQEMAEEIQNIGQECQDGLDNMPESLQYSPTGELLQERIDACENGSSEIECIDSEFEFEEEEFEWDDFDMDGYDTDEERDEAEEAFNIEENEAAASHEQDEEARKDSEFGDWIGDVKNELVSAISDCEM